MKVVVGINTCGEVFPLGTWVRTSRDAISKQWGEQKMKFPDSSILICDGGPGLMGPLLGRRRLNCRSEGMTRRQPVCNEQKPECSVIFAAG